MANVSLRAGAGGDGLVPVQHCGRGIPQCQGSRFTGLRLPASRDAMLNHAGHEGVVQEHMDQVHSLAVDALPVSGDLIQCERGRPLCGGDQECEGVAHSPRLSSSRSASAAACVPVDAPAGQMNCSRSDTRMKRRPPISTVGSTRPRTPVVAQRHTVETCTFSRRAAAEKERRSASRIEAFRMMHTAFVLTCLPPVKRTGAQGDTVILCLPAPLGLLSPHVRRGFRQGADLRFQPAAGIVCL